ncbi:MAG: polyprenyl synthetase family protein [Solirubrobacteraceae bacterium]
MSEQSNGRLLRLTVEEIESAASLSSLSGDFASAATYLVTSRGKQIRSSLLLAAALAGSDPNGQLVRTAAVAVELFHLATLAHDDVVDDGRLRRGAQTVGAVYGNHASGFIGGALVARAAELISECGARPTRMFAQAASRVCAGQMAEFEDLFDAGRSAQRYYLAILGKTAALFELAAWLGAWLAGTPSRQVKTLASFGREIGTAFQVADDILDIAACETETGKRRAKDLEQGVYTLPVIYALASDEALSVDLPQTFSEDTRDILLERIVRSGGLEVAARDRERHFENARLALTRDRGLSVECVDELALLLDQVMARNVSPATEMSH